MRSVTAAAIASRSCASSPSSGTGTGEASATCVTIGYASNERHAKTTSSPGAQVACTSCWHRPTEPQPTATLPGGTPARAASREVNSAAPLSG
ncbi:hypothetical protein GCM10023353_05350 [Tomitella cavernea]|uniref:Secreted protein n=1 Tax=Tomitella cavernea TaxID=1387982 RepID=A0ABP9C5S9_9ACTN